jgi:hypothetical protein
MSSAELIRSYFAERYRPGFFVPLAILLYATGAMALGTTTTVPRSIAGIAIAYGLVLVFRIADDLADRDADRQAHPTRITVVAGNLAPLRIVVNATTFLIAGAVAVSPARVVLLTALTSTLLLLGAWYFLRTRLGSWRTAPVVLLKYPAIAFMAATMGATSSSGGGVTARPVAGFAAIYLLACTYELLHDRGLRT